MPQPRLALIGCGAIAERFHAPALRARRTELGDLLLVDPSLPRAETLRAQIGFGSAVQSLDEVLGSIDGAILTAPHHLHASLGGRILEAGVPLLSEKPLAGSYTEAKQLVDLAAARGIPLSVNNTRRLFPAHREAKRLIVDGAIGELREIDFEDGDKFDWPLASPSLFGTQAGGRGILLDIGAHVVDLVCWWLGTDPRISTYEDDAMGGTEAFASVGLQAGSATAHIKLSWLGKLRNGFVIRGTQGEIHGGIYDWNSLALVRGGRRTDRARLGNATTFGEFALPLLDGFLDSISSGAAPLVSGRDVLPSLAVIDGCYERRQRIAMPWFDAWTKVAS